MITLRKAEHRRRKQRSRQVVWSTFDPRHRTDPLANGFGALERFGEVLLPPAGIASGQLPHNAELVTYVRKGALAHQDSAAHSGVIHAGEFQRMTATQTVRRSEKNASRTQWAHIFRIWLCPRRQGLTPGYETKRFTTAERRGLLCVVASPDARRGSLRIHGDVLLFSALLDPGQHVIHELAPGRSAWLHLVRGQALLEGNLLATGDGAGITAERAVSLTAQGATEILLLDLPQP